MLLTAASAIGLASYSLHAAQKSEKVLPKELSFVDKYVVLFVAESNALERSQNTEVLEKAELREIGGRYFIVGTAVSPPDADSHWRTGAQVGVPWDNVQLYYAYDPEQFKNYLKYWAESDDE
jgi:hypothetical protein